MSGPSSQNPTGKIYQTVIDDVINSVREAFVDEGYDENVLHELRQLWEGKLKKSKVVEFSGTENRTNPVYLQSVIPSGSTQTVYPITTSGQAGATAATMQIPASLSQNLIQINGQSFLIPSGTTNLVVGQNNQQNRINQVDGTADDEESGKSSDEDSLHSKPKQVDQKSRKKGRKIELVFQHDGANDSSSSSDTNSSEESDKDDEEEEQGEEEKSLNSEDDVSEEDPGSVFDVENLVVCLYDKINRNKTKWKFNLKDGIMNLKGKDYVFQKALGDADW